MKKRFLSVFLCLCLAVGMLPTTALAASKTADEAIAWASSQVGHSVGYDDGSGYYQCVEFIQAYYQWLGAGTPYGNAADYATNALPSGWTRTPGSTPQKGDILVYAALSGTAQQYGHVAIYESDNVLYDQNGNVYGATVQRQQAYYRTYTPNYWGCIHPNFALGTSEPSVTFSPWENSKYTYIQETDAAIGQEITVSNGNCTNTGMYLYDANGRELASANNGTYDIARVYFKINEECGYTLTPGTTYKYKFYAIVNGQTYWGDMGSFQTLPSSTSSQPSNPSDNLPVNTSTEVEPNDTLNSANSISVNQEMAGNIRNTSDKDWFVFQVPNDGHISITFDHDFVNNSNRLWETAFYTSDNERLSSWLWRGNSTSAGTGSEIGVSAGTYYLRIKRDDYFSSATYRFTVNYTASNSWEKEFNETIVTANLISTGVEISGSIMDNSDVDWYRFDLPDNGMISITFSHDFVNNYNRHWETAFYTSDNERLSSWLWRGDSTSVGIGSEIGVSAGTYYLRIKRDDYFSSATYRFTVNYTASGSWEQEFNETIVTANPISTGKEISGSIMDNSDVDWYRFDLPDNGMISITFNHDFVNSSNRHWETAFFSSDNKGLNSWSWRGNATSAETGSKIGVSAGTYYLRIKRDDYFSSATYRFTVNFDRGGDTQKPVPANGITLNRSNVSLTVGGSSTLTATVQPSNAADKTVQWHSSNTKVAIVQDGKVTATGAGNTVITASCGDVSATCMVTVSTKVVPANGITLNRSSLSLSAGNSAMLTAAIMPSDATDTTVAWRSENTSVATVVDGKVTAVKEGSTKIEASCGGFTATCLVSVTAKESQIQPSDVHFERVNTYFQDQFTDVPANQWYTNYVAEAFELGLMKGDSKTTFNPYGDVKISEAITMAARIHSIFTRGYEDFQQTGDKWYQVYLDYAYENGIINLAYYNCDVSQKASRAQFAEIFANSMPAEGLTAINDVADGAIPDVNMGNRYAKFIYMLYRAGILTGSDANGTFNPSTYITRAEAATVVSRMAESNNRVSITLR